MRKEIWARLGDLRAAGLALIVIDKEADSVAGLADRHYIVEKGRIAWSGEPAALAANPALRESFLCV